MSNGKKCSECTYESHALDEDAFCGHPNVLKEERLGRSLAFERSSAGLCGPFGKNFQQRLAPAELPPGVEHGQIEWRINVNRVRAQMERRSVLQDWVAGLTFMQQTVLIAAVRGPDGMAKEHPVKTLLRWYRRCVLISAFDGKVLKTPYEPGGGSFTGPLDLTKDGHIDQYVGLYLKHLDTLPIHAHFHLLHAAEIVGYKHPDDDVKEFWRTFYVTAVNALHLHPESEEEMDRRLADNREQWLEREVVP